ncbi:MAG: hypothetical protein IPG95_13425 [Saprospiraceae bacterium]|nr:hypothetical protein [Saprospiraceae bacterium]
MKNQFFHLAFFVLTIAILSACSDDEDNCTPTAVPTNIIGTWNIQIKGLGISESGSGTFNADGTFSTVPEDLIIEGELNGKALPIKKYTADSASVTFRAVAIDNSASIGSDFDVKSNACNKIVFDVFGGLATMTFSR